MLNENESQGDFLPDLCSVHAVLAMVLVGELLSLAMVVVDLGLSQFDWAHFGIVSMLVQWVVLASAACLCPLRPWFRSQASWVAGATSYFLVLALTFVISICAQLLVSAGSQVEFVVVAQHLLISGVFAGVALRYFYIQQQLHNQQQAELLARIQALQSRIRPHFLFNSMNSIASLITSAPQTAEKMVEDLSALFRASLNEPAVVPLTQELSLCERFVAIEQLRLGSRLKVDWSIPDREKLESVNIPSFLMQPLIENAIYHGVQPLPKGGTVSVSIFLGRNVEITICNPVTSKPSKRSGGAGVAIQNIRNRLSALYGRLAHFQVEKSDTEFMVYLKYPINAAE